MDTPAARTRLLERATFGVRPGDVDSLRGEGEAWLASQLHPASLRDDGDLARRLEALPDPEREAGALMREMAPELERKRGRNEKLPTETRKALRERLRELTRSLAAGRLVRAVHSERALEEVMVDFWANHFTVSARKHRVSALIPAYEHRVLRPHALGRFEDLLLATARSPAMLVYLDNARSSVERQARSRRKRGGINENYARELLELHTLGVDGGYTQADVVEVARVFTGWSVEDRARPRFRFRERAHDPEPKRVLGQHVSGGGQDEGIEVLRRLARHPSTAKHVSQKLARRFVVDEPPEALVARATHTFQETQGDIAAVLATLLQAPELHAPESVKLKTPLELVASAVRASGGQTDGSRLGLAAARLGEAPWLAPSPAGYPDTADRWVDPGSMLERMAIMLALASGRIDGTRPGDHVPEIGSASRPVFVQRRQRLALALASPEFQWE